MKTLIILFLSILAACAATESDLLTGLDPTTLTSIKASQLLQMINNGTIGATNKGGIIRSAFTPDTINNPRYTNFVWIDTSAGLPGSIKSWNGTGWSSASFSAGSITATNLAPGAVTQAALATNAVDTINIVNSAVTSAKIGALQIINSLLGAGAVSNLNIADRTITGAKIATQTIENTNILDGSLSGFKFSAATITSNCLAAGSINNSILATNAVAATNIIAGAVNNAALATSSVQATNVNITGGTAGQVLTVDPGASFAKWSTPMVVRTTNFSVGLLTNGVVFATSFTHGLGGLPSMVNIVLTNSVTDLGYVAMDEAIFPTQVGVGYDATTVTLLWNGVLPSIGNRGTGTQTAITTARWGLKVNLYR